jgi:hypothetical protein
MFKQVILGVTLFGMQLTATAEPLSATSTVKTIFTGPHYSGLVFIQVNERPTQTRPTGCGQNGNFDFVLDLNSEHGKEHYSAILTAYAAQKTVRLISVDNCNIFPSVPTLSTIWLK